MGFVWVTQHLQFKMAEMAMDLHAARLMVRNAAAQLDAASPEATVSAAMAKKFATDVGFQVRLTLWMGLDRQMCRNG